MSKEAMKLALEALELNNNEWKSLADSGDSGYWKAEDQDHYQQTNKAITALREALAEQPAQPYKGIADHINQATNGRMRIDPVTGDVGIGTPSQQPAQRPWVGLTHEDIVIILNNDYGGSRADCIRAAEARLKERNT